MKYRLPLLLLTALLLSACNLSLAQDVTPPPNYVPPTPMPTLVLVPPQTPDTINGKAIYLEKCSPCHGQTGMGDGPQGIQLGVTVPAFALPEIAHPASPADWYTTVTRGRIERFMPPFVSLNDQQRWDVVAYIMSLHTSEAEIEKGKQIFEANCPNCSTDFYRNPANMASLSNVELARIVRLGNDQIKAFGADLSDDDMWAVADYLRSLSINTTPPPTPTVVPPTATSAASETAMPSTEGTPSAEATPNGTEQATASAEATSTVTAGLGPLSGAIENNTGKDLPQDTVVTLRGYEHDMSDPNAGPKEVVTQEGRMAADGSYLFENVELVENRIFVVEVTYEGVTLNTQPSVVAAGATSITMSPLKLYKVTDDTSLLQVDQLNMFFDTSKEATFEIVALYSFRNTSDSIITVKLNADQQEIPFLKYPKGTQKLGYQAGQDSAAFTGTNDGFAMAPSETPYSIFAISSMVREKENAISQALVLPVKSIRIFIPDGMELKGDLLTKDTLQDIQGTKFQTYVASDIKAGAVLDFTVSGSPKTAAAGTDTQSTNKNTIMLIGAGVLGLLFIIVGAVMFLRDRKRAADEEEEEEEEFESSDEVMDAIIALDDLFRSKKISEEAYQKRRAELKEILKERM